ncbi:hypothetical protein ACWCQN_25590 [Streptomyces sp. NPDC001984]
MSDAPAVDYSPDPLVTRFPPYRLCGTWPTALRLHPGHNEQLQIRITLVDCGHTVGVPWPAALALV